MRLSRWRRAAVRSTGDGVLRELGHEVRLLPAKMVRHFMGGNKNDAHDARAIWTAVQQPGIKPVAIKTEEQFPMRCTACASSW